MDLEEVQLELEDEMVSKGAKRYALELSRGLTGTGPGKELMRKALKPVAEALKETFEGSQSRAKKGVKHIIAIEPYVLADITMRRLLDCAAKEENLIKTCKAISKAVDWHVRDAELNAASRAIWNRTQERLAKTQNPAFRRASIDGTVKGMRKWAEENHKEDLIHKLADVKGCDWTINEQIDVGSVLIDCFCRVTKMVRTETIRKSRNRSKVIVRFTEGTQEWLEKQHDYHNLLRPVHLPMLVPPTNWSGMTAGGYIDNSKAGVKFIKTRANLMDLESLNLQDIYDSVNAIQSTPWRVNLSIMKIMNQVWDAGTTVGNVPPRHEEDGIRYLQRLPSRLADMTPEQRKQDPEFKTWATRRRNTHEFNAELKSEIKTFGSLMGVANRFAQYPAFWHPHKLDWRQRAYPISIFLNPQGDQFNKALIEFSEGKRMGDNENSGAWLAIHGANVFGEDKVSYDERIQWVEENHNEIIASAMDPFATNWWTTADKPWPFLAFCMEWLAYSIAGEEHITHLPVALDGSNSGLQHLSAMLRDPDGARITCLAPGEQPEDVYQMIADSVEATLKDQSYVDASADEVRWANAWSGMVTRKICKQPTMTYTYSATESGMRDQITSALKSLDGIAQDGGHPSYLSFTDPLQTNEQAAEYLAPIVRGAIKSRMSKAAEAMEFLQKVARTYAQTDLPLRWKTPLGVPVVQYYPTSTSKLKKVFINGQQHQLRITVDAVDRLDKKKTTSGVSPNYVHSMDSTHLLWTTLYCRDKYDMEDFAMIHDSFGTHATACDQLAYGLREMFIVLYEVDRLAEFKADTVALLQGNLALLAELPDVPEYGTFDIESVRDSEYFFA